jgi:purine-nucleoside phosphorylase
MTSQQKDVGIPSEFTQLAREAAETIVSRTRVETHDIALTLGSGWAKAADLIGETIAEIPANEVPGFSASGIPGHTGTIRSIQLPTGKHALVVGARTHFYEDKGVRAVAHGVRVAAACGAKIMVLTNGAGASKNHGHLAHQSSSRTTSTRLQLLLWKERLS